MDINTMFSGHQGGGETYKDWLIPWYTYTEGVWDMAVTLGAYWYLDLIFLNQSHTKGEPFQTWILTSKKGKAKIEVSDGNKNVLWAKTLPYTDMIEGELKLYNIMNEETDGEGKVIRKYTLMLPSEY